MDNKMIQSKLDKSDNYVLNAIVNHALYNFENYKRKIKKNNFTYEDIINQIAYESYYKEFYKKKVNTIKEYKSKILRNYFKGKKYKNKFIYALDRLGYEQEQVSQKFYEMFEDSKYEK